jgi:hypothetical protein
VAAFPSAHFLVQIQSIGAVMFSHRCLLTYVACVVFLAPATVLAVPVPLQTATATFDQGGAYIIANSIDGDTTSNLGWAIFGQHQLDQTAVWETQSDLLLPGGSLIVQLIQGYSSGDPHVIKKFRLAVTDADRTLFATGGAGGDVDPSPGTFTVLTPTSVTSTKAGQTFTIDGSQAVLASNPGTGLLTYTITAPNPISSAIRGMRLEVLSDAGLDGYSSNGNIVLTEIVVTAIPVPEPGSFSLCAIGAAGLFVVGRRRCG